MSIKATLGFVALTGITTLSADYYLQAQANGAALTEFGVQGYAESFAARFTDYIEDAREGEKPLIAYLPEAPSGWVRQPWSSDIKHLMNMENVPSIGQPIDHAPEAKLPNGVIDLAGVPAVRRGTIVYRRTSEIVLISIRKRNGGLVEAVSDKIAGEGEKQTFAAIKGVKFHEQLDMLGERVSLSRTYRGRIADAVDITIDARAREGSVKSLLTKIDYAGIVAALEVDPDVITDTSVNTLPQIPVGSKGKPISKTIEARPTADAGDASVSGFTKLMRWLGLAKEPKAEERRVVINRANREGCETNRGGCKMTAAFSR